MGLFDSWNRNKEIEVVDKANELIKKIKTISYSQQLLLNEFLDKEQNLYCDEELYYKNILDFVEKDIEFSIGYKLCKELYNTIVVESDNDNDINRFNKFKELLLNHRYIVDNNYTNIDEIITDFKNAYNLFNNKEAFYNIYNQIITNKDNEVFNKEKDEYIKEIITFMVETRKYFNDEGAYISCVIDTINKVNEQSYNKEMRTQLLKSSKIIARQLAGFYEVDEVYLATLPQKVKKITDDMNTRYNHLVQTFSDKESAVNDEKNKAIAEFKKATSGILGEADQTIAKIKAAEETGARRLEGLDKMITNKITNFLDENPEAEEILRAKDSGYNEFLDETIPAKDRYTKAILLKNPHTLYHERFDDSLKNVLVNQPVLLQGPSGCGKSTVARQNCEVLNLKFINIGFIADEFVSIRGYMDANGNYVKSLFYDCYKYGYGCFIDEIDNSEPKALLELNKITGTDGFLPYTFPNGEIVEPHPNFRLFAAANTFGEGGNSVYHRNPMDSSSLDRFSIIKLSYDKDLEQKIMKNHKDVYEFLLAFRDAVNNKNIQKLLVTTKTMASIAKQLDSGIISLTDALESKLIKGENPETLETICNSIIQETGNTNVTKAFQKAIKKDSLLRK